MVRSWQRTRTALACLALLAAAPVARAVVQTPLPVVSVPLGERASEVDAHPAPAAAACAKPPAAVRPLRSGVAGWSWPPVTCGMQQDPGQHCSRCRAVDLSESQHESRNSRWLSGIDFAALSVRSAVAQCSAQFIGTGSSLNAR